MMRMLPFSAAMSQITGSTRCLALIGHPVDQVRTPPAFNRWFAENGIDAVVLPVDLESDALPAYFVALRGWRNCIGLSVTMPYKMAAVALVDECTFRVRQSGALNVVRRETDGRLIGDMVDGLAFVTALATRHVTPAGRDCVVVGAGGAGSAIAHALAQAGASRLTVLDIDIDRSARLLQALRRAHPGIVLASEADRPERIDILVNASPLGMKPGDPLPFPVSGLRPDAFVADAVTKPAITAFLSAAMQHGCGTQTGHDMADAQLPFQIAHLGLLPAT